MPPESLAATLTRERLLKLAGDRSYERGERYARDGHVGDVAEDRGHLTAFVTGTDRYRSDLWVIGSKITYACTCPVGADGACCKHCVAVGLQWLESQASAVAGSKRASNTTAARGKRSAGPRPLTMKDVRAYLATLAADTLVELVMQLAMEDERLRRRLLHDAAKVTGSGVKLHTYRKAISDAIGAGDFIHYREAGGYFAQIHDVVSSIDELLPDEPAAVIELVEHALTLLEHAIGHIDDSDGHASEVLVRLQALHLAACKRARPDPEVLAQRLFDWEMRSEWDVFFGAVSRYADVLGTVGMTRYRALADDAWRTVPVLGAGHPNRAFSSTRFRITSMMESLARLSGDVDAVADVKARDLSSAYAYLTIAELYLEARRKDDALDWAERGVAAFPDNTDSRLREFLATQYLRKKRVTDAMSLLWLNFADRPLLPHYVALHKVAEPAGVWPAWRERALTEVRTRIVRRSATSARTFGAYAVDGSLLVEILLWEGDADAAWITATESGCSERLWLQLAKRREKSHPNDAVAVYQAAVERTVSRTNNEAYHDAVAMLRVIARVMKQSSVAGGFAAYLASVRTRHKAKRNFMKLLDAARL
jgi:uncharacterized Zn finger protein